MGISMDNVMAIGDSENDIDMLRAAGIGVAMGNAGDDVKAEADYIVASNDDDGVVEALERFAFCEQISSTSMRFSIM